MGRYPILLVDDEDRMTRSAGRFLRSEFSVATASCAAEAFDLIDSHGPAVIVSDYRMPGGDGVGLLGEVGKHYPHVARILLTGFADLDIAIAAINEANVFRLLLKPTPPKQLREAIEAGVDWHLDVTARSTVGEAAADNRLLDAIAERFTPSARRIGLGLADRICRLGAALSVDTETVASAARMVPGVLGIAMGSDSSELLAPHDSYAFVWNTIQLAVGRLPGILAASDLGPEVRAALLALSDLGTVEVTVPADIRLLRFVVCEASLRAGADGYRLLLDSRRHPPALIRAAAQVAAGDVGVLDVAFVSVDDLGAGTTIAETIRCGGRELPAGHVLSSPDLIEIRRSLPGGRVLGRVA